MKTKVRALAAGLLIYRAAVIALLSVVAYKLPAIEYDAWQAGEAAMRAEHMAAMASDSADAAAETARRTASTCLLINGR